DDVVVAGKAERGRATDAARRSSDHGNGFGHTSEFILFTISNGADPLLTALGTWPSFGGYALTGANMFSQIFAVAFLLQQPTQTTIARIAVTPAAPTVVAG